MTAKEYLNQARTLDMLINAKQDELYKLRLMAESVSSPQIGEKVKSSGGNNAMSVVDKIVDLQRQINCEIDKLIDQKAEIHQRIQCVYHPVLIAVLTDRYINGLTLEQIAEKMNRSKRTICVWHGQALQIFRKETGLK